MLATRPIHVDRPAFECSLTKNWSRSGYRAREPPVRPAGTIDCRQGTYPERRVSGAGQREPRTRNAAKSLTDQIKISERTNLVQAQKLRRSQTWSIWFLSSPVIIRIVLRDNVHRDRETTKSRCRGPF